MRIVLKNMTPCSHMRPITWLRAALPSCLLTLSSLSAYAEPTAPASEPAHDHHKEGSMKSHAHKGHHKGHKPAHHHSFDPERFSKRWEGPDRDQEQRPAEVIKACARHDLGRSAPSASLRASVCAQMCRLAQRSDMSLGARQLRAEARGLGASDPLLTESHRPPLAPPLRG